MAEWNLSVKLTGQGTDLVGTLRRSSTEARKLQRDVDNARQAITRLKAASRGNIRIGVTLDTRGLRRDVQAAARGAGGQRITIPLGVDGSRLRQEVRRALTTAGTGSNITIPLNVDGAQLRSQIDRATAGAGAGLNSLRDAAQDASRALRTLRGRSAAASHELGDLRTQALAAAVGLRSINTAAGRADGRLEALSSRSRTFRTDLDELDGSVQRVGGNLGGLHGSIGGVGSSSQSASGGTQQLMMALAGLSTALVPIAASAAPITATLGAAGASVGAFGIALAGQVRALSDAADAQTKYDKAVRDHGPTSKQAAQAQQELQAQITAMPAPTRQASAALSSLKDQYQSWSDSLAGDTMPVAVHGFQTLSAVIPKLTPMVKSAAGQMDRLITITAGGIASDSFDRLFSSFSNFANSSLGKVTDGFVHLLRVLSGDAPAGSRELQAFMDYAKSVGPQVAATLKDLAKALLNIMVAASQMGVSVLTVVDAVAKLVSAVPSGALSVFFQLALALKAVQLATRGLSAGSAVVAAFATQITAARTAAAGASGPLASAAAGFMGLSRAAKAAVIGTGVGILLIALTQIAEIGKAAPPDIDRLTTSLGKFAKTGSVTGEAARVFGKDLGGLADSLRTLSRPSNFEKTDQFLTSLIGMDSTPVARSKEDIDGLDKALAGLVKNGNPQLAEAALTRMQKKMGNLTPKELRAQLDDYKSALADAAFEQQLAAESMGLFGQQALSTSQKLDAQKASADGLRQAITALNDVNRQGLGGMIGFEAAIDAAAEAAKRNAGALSMTGGQLNLNSAQARNAATALNDLAAKTDAAAGSARESGASWEAVNGIYARGRQELVSNAVQMGLTKSQAEALASSILKIPDSKTTRIQMRNEDAIAGLQAVQAQIRATPNAKSVTVSALTAGAIAALEHLGFRVTHMDDGTVRVTVPTAGPKYSVSAIQSAINGLHGKSVTNTVTTVGVVKGTFPSSMGRMGRTLATGGPVRGYADGGDIQMYPQGGYVQGPGTGTSDSIHAMFSTGPAMISNTEYVVRAAAVEKYGLRFLDAVNSGQLPKFASGGSIPKLASGGFSYTPNSARRTVSDVQSSYSSAHQPITKDEYNKKLRARANAVDSLRSAEARLSQVRHRKHTHAQLVSAENSVAKARRSVATATEAARTAESRYKKTFSLSDWQKTLKSAVGANASWESNLNKIASRGAGADVINQLRDMGNDGAAMVSALAKASKRQFADIVANLRKLAPLAKATLADYTKQINASTKTSTTFQQNLSKIAAMGYGDLAMQLAGQGDDAAQKIAAEAAGSKTKAKAANSSAKNASKTLTGDELGQLVQIIAAVKSSKTGIHDVAGTTGLGEDDIVAVATKASSQIKSSLGSRSTRFLADLTRAQKGLSYANGGIRPGLYGTKGGAVTFAEPSTGGEAYIPLGANKRASATAVLGDVAHRFGVGLTDASAGRVVVISQEGATTVNVPVTKTNASAYDIGHQVGRQMRRAKRGGVAARAGH